MNNTDADQTQGSKQDANNSRKTQTFQRFGRAPSTLAGSPGDSYTQYNNEDKNSTSSHHVEQ